MGRAVSGCYPRWLGWVAVLAGILSTAVGFIQGLSANRRALSGLDDHWAHGHHAVAAVDGIMLLRKVRETPIRAVETDAQDAA
jgi:hypothetical protein